MTLPFSQAFEINDIAVVGLLVVLEGVLSIDNALVLGLLAKRLPKPQQRRALMYGLVGAFAFRFVAIAVAQQLLQWRIIKLLGGGYLIFVAWKYFFIESRQAEDDHFELDTEGAPVLVDDISGRPITGEREESELEARMPVPGLAVLTESEPAVALPPAPSRSTGTDRKFWTTVGVIELTDIAFAVDSILAAIALVGPAPATHNGLHPKLWVVVTGGLIGLVLMRVAASVFIRLLERFPRFEVAAYLLVAVIGAKLTADWYFNSAAHPHRLDFHSPGSLAFWTFWALMLLCLGVGFIPKPTAQKCRLPQDADAHLPR
jgi:YkoY family integral membrane protein